MHMEKRFKIIILATVFLFFACLHSHGQQRRYWSDGPLTWSDFRIAETPDTRATLSVSWIKDLTTVKSGKTVFKDLDVQTISIPDNSWVGKAMLSDEELALQQYFFNQAEWIGRTMRDTLLRSSVSMRNLSRMSAQRLRSERYDIINGKLGVPFPENNVFDITTIDYTTSRVGFGASVQLGCSLPYGDMADICGFFPTALASVEASSGRMYIDSHLLYARGEYEGKGLYCFGWNLGPGYIFLNKNDFSLSAFGAIGSKTVYFKPDPSKGVYLMEGLRIDYLLRNELSFLSDKAMYKRWLRLSIFADQLYNSSKGIFIPSINVSIGIAFLRNGLKINY